MDVGDLTAGPLRRVLEGARHVLRGAQLVARDRALLKAALVPTAITVLCCVAFAWLSVSDGVEEGDTALHAFAAAFFAVSSMPPTLLQRQWTRVALTARHAVGTSPGELERPNEGYFRMLARETWKALRQALAVAVGLGPLLIVLKLLPFTRFTFPVVTAAWAGYWTIVDAFEIPAELVPGKQGLGTPTWFERAFKKASDWHVPFFGLGSRFAGWVAKPWRYEVRFTERHPWETLGFGLAAGVFLFVPGLGLFFRAVSITGATSLIAHCGESERTLEAPAAAPAAPAPAEPA